MSAASERRHNPLTGEWTLVSPGRTARPWQGQTEAVDDPELPRYEPDCYLCPGNGRAGGVDNPRYETTFAFDNDYPALTGAIGDAPRAATPLFAAEPVGGACRVVCYSPRHDERFATLSDAAAILAMRRLFAEFRVLDERPEIAYVQIFENRGTTMGCSNPHPHAQIWATSVIPDEARKESEQQARYFGQHHSTLLGDYADAELAAAERLVVAGERFLSVVPFWAVWPFELLILPISSRGPSSPRTLAGPEDFDDADVAAFALTLRDSLAALDALFGIPMPYSLGFHPRPSDGAAHPEWVFHAHVYPPLLRSATVKKHMVGFEMLGMPQRDLTPEHAAAMLRATRD